MKPTKEQNLNAHERGAIFSPCKKYRYVLWRFWNNLLPPKYIMFIGLNPSTADEIIDDPTIRRCTQYSKSWGYSGLYMMNLFAFRATLPKIMKMQIDPIGPDNDHYLIEVAQRVDIVIAVWGINGSYLARDKTVQAMIPRLYCLGFTKNGHPRHPLYLSKKLNPILWIRK